MASSALPVQLENVTEAELISYLRTPAIGGEVNPLSWWKVHKVNFPQLCKMARKYLCVAARGVNHRFCHDTICNQFILSTIQLFSIVQNLLQCDSAWFDIGVCS